jgi:hypothetical protein
MHSQQRLRLEVVGRHGTKAESNILWLQQHFYLFYVRGRLTPSKCIPSSF